MHRYRRGRDRLKLGFKFFDYFLLPWPKLNPSIFFVTRLFFFLQLPVRIRGPYGVSFTRAFEHKRYPSIVVVGAGTGVVSGVSVIRELIARRRKDPSIRQYVWMVWSCTTIDDLLWYEARR